MLTLSLYFLVNYRSRHTNRDLICSAVLLSLAILGRQQYLLLLPLFVVYVFMERIDNRRIWRAFQFLVVAILLPSSLFVIWKGIVPNVGGDVANAG